MTPEEIIRRVLYRDALLLVLDKPAGHPVHRGPRNAHGDEPLDRLFAHLRFGLPRDPELAHRLDRDTSGCLALGRHRQALARLADLFKRGEVAKTYWAVVEGGPAEEEGRIDLPLGRLDETRGWWMKVDPQGQPCETRWRLMGRSQDGRLSWLAMSPITGRTHQLRVHAKAMGWPILGDAVYGSAPRFGGPGLQLLARRIEIPLYPRKPPIAVEAPVPAHMRETLASCGWSDAVPGGPQGREGDPLSA